MLFRLHTDQLLTRDVARTHVGQLHLARVGLAALDQVHRPGIRHHVGIGVRRADQQVVDPVARHVLHARRRETRQVARRFADVAQPVGRTAHVARLDDRAQRQRVRRLDHQTRIDADVRVVVRSRRQQVRRPVLRRVATVFHRVPQLHLRLLAHQLHAVRRPAHVARLDDRCRQALLRRHHVHRARVAQGRPGSGHVRIRKRSADRDVVARRPNDVAGEGHREAERIPGQIAADLDPRDLVPEPVRHARQAHRPRQRRVVEDHVRQSCIDTARRIAARGADQDLRTRAHVHLAARGDVEARAVAVQCRALAREHHAGYRCTHKR